MQIRCGHCKTTLTTFQNGPIFSGKSFGAKANISGEAVFTTSLVGYPESMTDPSYRGQILVITFPLVGNYGVPSRETMDELLGDLPAHFESSEIHIAGLVTASYCGEDFSHFLAESSLGTWLKEQGVPAMYGVDTRALTKKLRETGSMLGKMRLESGNLANGTANGTLVNLWTCNGAANQQWNVSNGTLVNPQSGRCLDIPALNTANGTQLDIWDCDNGSNQKWNLPS